MWPWIAGGWALLSLLLALLHARAARRRPRIPPDVRRFLLRFESELARRHPEGEYRGLLPGRFAALLSLHGQETPVALQGVFRHAKAFPEAFGPMVDRLIEDIVEVGLDRIEHHDFSWIAPWILPQVRSREWLLAQGRFGDEALVHRALNEELVVVFVIDDPQTMVYICKAHLRAWGRGADEIDHLAIANLRRLSGDGIRDEVLARGPLLIHNRDGYDAARLLLLDRVDGLLVAVPDRDILWMGREQSQDLQELMAAAEEIAKSSDHPVSPKVFRARGGALEPVERPAPLLSSS
ncbi:MAG: hypothetical protein Fur0037_10350 [Planctomycetota bacterium]